MTRYLLYGLPAVLLFAALLHGQKKPEISLSETRVKSGGQLILMATGFTPNRTALSHLRRPDGSEYNRLRFYLDERGEFSHKIDTAMLDIGTFELWVDDEASKAVSNRVRFTVE
jgi:hypothetical protein